MRNPSKSPAELSSENVRDAVGGDEAAMTRVARLVLPRVRNLVRYLIRDDRDVDDVAQEGLIAVLRGLGTYRGDGKFESWVDRVVARQTFAWLKRRSTREQHIHEITTAQEMSDAAPRREIHGRPDDFMQRRRVASALDGLPDEQRHTLVLHHVLEMTVPEVAEEMRVPQETVRSRLRLGRRRMRAALAPIDADSSPPPSAEACL